LKKDTDFQCLFSLSSENNEKQKRVRVENEWFKKSLGNSITNGDFSCDSARDFF